MGYEAATYAGEDVLIAGQSCELVHTLYVEYTDLLVESMLDETTELL